MIAEWDRATHSMWDGLQIIKPDRRRSLDQGARSRLNRPRDAHGARLHGMLSALAENEHLRIIKRTHEGRKLARANGVCFVEPACRTAFAWDVVHT
jgi:hypothetical protein